MENPDTSRGRLNGWSENRVDQSSSSIQSDEGTPLNLSERTPLLPRAAANNYDGNLLRNAAAFDDDVNADGFPQPPVIGVPQPPAVGIPQPHQIDNRTTECGTMMHLLKGNIGIGILALPKAVSQAGLAVGSIGLVVIGAIAIHCMNVLVNSSDILIRRHGLPPLDYASAAEKAFLHGPQKLRRFSGCSRIAVNVFLVLTQCGFCCVYFLFVATSIHEVVVKIHGSSPLDISGIMTIIWPLIIAVSFIRNLQDMSWVSTLANVFQIIGLLIVFYFLLRRTPPIDSVPVSGPLEKFPLYFGTAMYAFEGIGLVLPLKKDMRAPEAFVGVFGVMNTIMMIVVCMYFGVGFFGYWKYGDKVESSITLNIDAPVVSEGIHIMFAIAILLTYGLQFYVPVDIIWPSLKEKFDLQRFSARRLLILELFFRAILVTITFALAISIPMLDLVISLVGALASSCLALIFPPIIEIATIFEGPGSRRLYVIIAKDILIILLGLLGAVAGTYTSIVEIVDRFNKRG